MPLSDPIGDLLTRMRNAQHGRRTECRAPWSRIKQALCDLLKAEGYLKASQSDGAGPTKEVVIAFRDDRPALTLKRISRPGARTYVSAGEIRHFLHGNSLAVLSTSIGLVTDKIAREKNVGGELLCSVS
jgi:small subunit ribosomal protein S8